MRVPGSTSLKSIVLRDYLDVRGRPTHFIAERALCPQAKARSPLCGSAAGRCEAFLHHAGSPRGAFLKPWKSNSVATRQALRVQEASPLESCGHRGPIRRDRLEGAGPGRVAISHDGWPPPVNPPPRARRLPRRRAGLHVGTRGTGPGLGHCGRAAGFAVRLRGLADSMRRQDCESAGCEIPVARAWGWRIAGSSPSRRPRAVSGFPGR